MGNYTTDDDYAEIVARIKRKENAYDAAAREIREARKQLKDAQSWAPYEGKDKAVALMARILKKTRDRGGRVLKKDFKE